MEKRTYLSLSEDLVGIADVAVISRPSSSVQSEPQSNVTLLTRIEPTPVKLPMPETVNERYLEIREIPSGKVITIIELLSPSNKRLGEGRELYEKKRMAALQSQTNWIEIDLLRRGKPMPVLGVKQRNDYRILVCRGDQLPDADLYEFGIRQAIPPIPIPLKPRESEPEVNLQHLLTQVYDQARFDLAIDYSQDPIPPLPETDQVWADTRLQEQGRR